MIPTRPYVERKFEEYNALCFEGKLRPLPVRLCSARTFLGQVTCRRERGTDGAWHYTDFTLRISTKIDLPEQVVEDVILHEMIHYWILSNGLHDTGPHGELFVRKMREINLRYDRNISVSHRQTEAEQAADREVRRHLICFCRLRTGQRGVMVAARSRLFELWDAIPAFPGIAEWRWFVSTDPFFNRFPRATKPRIYPVHVEELEAHLKDAKELVREGNTIRVKAT